MDPELTWPGAEMEKATSTDAGRPTLIKIIHVDGLGIRVTYAVEVITVWIAGSDRIFGE